MHRITASLLLLLACLATGSPAKATIDPGAKMDENPIFSANFALTFSAPVDVKRSTVEVLGPNGRIVVGTLARSADPAELLIPLRGNLPPGTYMVHFTAYATTGEEMSGASSIEVPETSGSVSYSPQSLDLYGAK